ncbi:MAG: DUF4124 domain-containing protein [Steroidobacteraceae bacterium]
MLRSSISALTLIIAVVASAQADVYKYVDAQGHVQYTDKPQTLPAQRLNVRSQKTDTVALQEREETERKRQEEAEKARKASSGQNGEQREAAQLSAKDKAERCNKARERYDNYVNSQRLYEPLPNGERRYLSDAELDAARASAKVSMDELCKGL